MKQSTGKGRRTWFWIGVVLLSISALFWLIFIPVIVQNPDLGGVILLILVTAIPIGIGIYGVRRGRKAPAVATAIEEATRRRRFAKDTQAEIVTRPTRKDLLFAWLFLVWGIPLLFCGLWVIIMERDASGIAMLICGLFPTWFGIWCLSEKATKVTFNQPPGYITVIRGVYPLNLWLLGRKRISREEAGSVRVHDVRGFFNEISHQVEITTQLDKEVVLHRDDDRNVVEYLAQRIREFG